MNSRSSVPQRFPFTVFWTVLVLVCLALALSAIHTYQTLGDLRSEYLRNRGHDVATAIEQQTRGPGRRSNLQIWQQTLDEVRQQHSGSVAFISLVDSAGEVLVHSGTAPAPGDSFLLTVQLEKARGRGWGQVSGSGSGSDDWHIDVALYLEQARFIDRQARIQAAAAGAAILALLGLGFYFIRTLDRFLTLKNREEAEKHLAALGAMSATLAHEIRNPLGAMKGLTQVVQEDLPSGHASLELMSTVVKEAERLEKLVNDLLTFARPGELRLTEFDLAKLVQEVSGFLTPQAEEKGVTIQIPPRPVETMIYSDQDGLRQILLNLLINALESTPRDTRVEVSYIRDKDKRFASLTIRDEGPGIGDTDPAELFQPFKTTKVKGSGLGLAISNQITQRLGGSITLENSPEGGTLCKLRIPVVSV